MVVVPSCARTRLIGHRLLANQFAVVSNWVFDDQSKR